MQRLLTPGLGVDAHDPWLLGRWHDAETGLREHSEPFATRLTKRAEGAEGASEGERALGRRGPESRGLRLRAVGPAHVRRHVL